ncbi:MAG TPA: hypothetical protein DHW61_10755 [Lachnoclostridium phytofermentans]|uniref:Uncharacterized protein n=1 Tax=Lachnoclostridium phytofermentans TaxID=66219 RepID=A0A3D2X6X5_9FIRM|nr:hypothetical protein [Lachnoclostridium phytofermentans]
MGLNDYLAEFCKKRGYTYKLDYNAEKKEYSIIIGNEKEAGAFIMTKEEVQDLSNKQIKNMLKFLDEGIQLRTKARE